jgi:tripartite-type tricarboxylate transporter receptor subunit TctC
MRKITITIAIAATMGTLLSVPAAHAEYPEKNIDFIIPFGPGGGFDRTVRLIAPSIEKALPNKVEVLPKNVPGAGGRKGMSIVYRAKPDGYMMTIANMPGAAMPGVLGEKVEYDLPKFTWIARIASEEYMIGVPAKSNIKSIEDLRKLGRPVKFPNTGFGSTGYAATAILGEVLKFPINHLTGYKGTNAYIVGTIRGDADAAVAPVSTFRKFVQSGDIRPLVTMEAKSSMPGVPTIAELGHPELTGLAVERFVLAPPGLPANVAKTLSEAFSKAVEDPAYKAATTKSGEALAYLPADEARVAADKSLAIFLKYKSVIGKKN